MANSYELHEKLFQKPFSFSLRLQWTRNNAKLKHVCLLAIFGTMVANSALTGGFALVSRLNYPGGEAFAELHKLNRDDGAGRLTLLV